MQMMFIAHTTRNLKYLRPVRRFCTTAVASEKKPSIPNVNEPKTSDTVDEVQAVLGKRMYRVNNFDRWMLAWVKRYPSKHDVPDKVTEECILQARARARVKTCHYMMAFSIIALFLSAISGKRDAAAGKTLLSLQEERREAARKAAEEKEKKS